MKIASLPAEDQQRLKALADNFRSMQTVAVEEGQPMLAAIVNYMGQAILKDAITIATLSRRVEYLEEFIEEHLS